MSCARTVAAPRSYGNWGRLVQRFAALAFAASCMRPAGAAERPIKIVAFGDSLMAGYQLAAKRRFPGAARKGAQGQGPQRRGRQRRRVRRHRLGRACPARLVGAGRHRRGDRRARRQRHAARRRSQGHARGAGADRQPAEAARHRGDAVRHAGGAELRRGLRKGVQRDLSGACLGARSSSSIRSSSTASRPMPSSISATACIRPRPASKRLSHESHQRLRS